MSTQETSVTTEDDANHNRHVDDYYGGSGWEREEAVDYADYLDTLSDANTPQEATRKVPVGGISAEVRLKDGTIVHMTETELLALLNADQVEGT